MSEPMVEKLIDMNPREIWPTEDRDFTPWLAKHLDDLSAIISMDLQLIEKEAPVGGFRSDLVCKELGTESSVIVENQLEESDHDHLGKILTYAAGREARTVVWISTSFRDEHVQAIRWLNTISREDVSFFGVRLRAVKIGTSQPAMDLTVVVGPSDWEKTGAESSLTESDKLRREFFGQIIAAVPTQLRGNVTKPATHWQSFSSGKSSCWYQLEPVGKEKILAAMMIDTGNRDETKRAFERFELLKSQVEHQFGESLEWNKSPGTNRSWIGVKHPFAVKDRATWEPAIAWSIERLTRLKAVFGPLIQGDHDL